MSNPKLDLSNTTAAPIGTLVALRPTGDLPPLCCVPPASGSAFAYASLAQLLPPERPVYAFEAPGFDDGQTPVESLGDLSAGYLTRVREIPWHGPHLLLGWSMGGTVAFDMACRLRAQGETVAALILVDTMAPDVTELPAGAQVVREFLLDCLGGEQLPAIDLDAMWAAAPQGDRARHLLTEMQFAGHFDADLDMEILAGRFDVFRASIEVLRGNRQISRYEGKLTLIKAADSPPELHKGWDGLASDIEAFTLPGDHHSIWQGGGLQELSRVIQECLGRVPGVAH